MCRLALEHRRPPESAIGYPPLRTGLRGSHPGSFEVAHELALQGRTEWGAIDAADPYTYDLVVVGGGISGLAAAYLYREDHPSARILILENHDDFGGHAKRNEFRIGDRTIIGYGGSQTLESPQYYSDGSKRLLQRIGIDLKSLGSSYDQGFYRRHGLGGGIFFDRATYGVDRVVRFEVIDYSSYIPLAPTSLTPEEAVARMPVSEAARRELLRLFLTRENRLPAVPADLQEEYLSKISYRRFLEQHLDIREPETFALLQGIATGLGVTLDAAPAVDMLMYVGLPGYGATRLPGEGFDDDPYIMHFPDGNASIARLLVRDMIPLVAPGRTMEDVVGARFDYAHLDEPSSSVRLRLESTAIRVEHEGPVDSADRVAVTYVRRGRTQQVFGHACVLAGYNAMIPYLCPELPQPQREALALAVKIPILYSTVLLRNWRAWDQLGIAAVSAPGSYHANAMLDFPVSMGGTRFSSGPEEPIVVHMERFGGDASKKGMTPREQSRAERYAMLATPFSRIEREIRTQLTGTLSGGDFDPARDIEAITVNRWAHGYSYLPNPLFDSSNGEEAPHVIGREPFGRVVIANSDAGARATIDSAIDQASRAIGDLTRR